MKKQFNKTLALFTLLLTATFAAKSQTSTEPFETESHGSTSFTDNGVIFNILSHNGLFDIQANYPGAGWNGIANDNRFIDNTGTANQPENPSFSIKTTSNLFKVPRFWVYASAANLNLNVTGTLTVTGKLSGVTKFTQTKTTGFATSLGTTNGYTLIDLTNLNGQNYSNIIIDQLQITGGGNYRYLGLDAFTWVKDSNVLPVSLTNFSASLSNSGILNAKWKTASESNNSHFILQSSKDGKSWKDLVRQDAAINGASGASYEVEINIANMSLAGFTLLGFLLLPFSRRRYRLAALLAVMTIIAGSCAKEKDLNWIDQQGDKSTSVNTIYLRLAQVDHDGTTTYSEPVAVKAK
ncbi:hypothetical protein [Desertivirga xinjiangensis]|uniref:hypothetical protein n=1 Tax=Desertivirga xinjiangensis TaxID=539206 RepID=UPI00210ADD8A|nr:hypothetical protein [Pedobacter xinjiangensis]